MFEPYTKELYDTTFQWIAERGIFDTAWAHATTTKRSLPSSTLRRWSRCSVVVGFDPFCPLPPKPEFALSANGIAWRRADIGSANGHGTARSLSRALSPISASGKIDRKTVRALAVQHAFDTIGHV